MKISILTATYNRANLLPRLYESILENNKTYSNFEWLIMDDGSKDNTKEIVTNWQNDNKIDIKYYYQENAGKMAAINNLIDYSNGDIIIEMDSDDYFLPGVFKKISNDYKHLDKNAYGILYRNDIPGKEVISKFPFENEIKKLFDLHYRYNFNFDTAITFRSEIRKKFKYELVDNERFITEASTYYKMDDKYHGLLVKSDTILVREYQEDGYSENIIKIFKKYPKGYYKFFNYLVNHNKKGLSFNKKLYFMKHYILFSVLNNKTYYESLKNINNLLDRMFFTSLYIPGKIKTNRMFKRKKILFTSYSMGLGGIETALVSLLNHLDLSSLNVTLILEHKEGKFLNDIDKRIKVKEYRISNSKNIFLRKIYNRLKLILWTIKNYHKYDFAVSYATYSIPGGLLALSASKNNAIWVHNNYYRFFNCDEHKMINYLKEIKFPKFKKIVFVSEDNLHDVVKYAPEYKDKAIVCNNFIDGEKIISKSKETVDIKKTKTTFVNVGRHDEKQKRISRILEATMKLKDKYDFEVWLIGEGEDTKKYQDFVKENHLSDYIKFLGFKKNPYAYMKEADALLLSSDYEGYPVVFIESMILDLPIVSTKISDYKNLEGKYGIFKENSGDGVYEAMNEFLSKGFSNKEKFNYLEFNDDIKDKLNDIFEIEE